MENEQTDIAPESIIDTSENKPRETAKTYSPMPPEPIEHEMVIQPKPVKYLSQAEKDYLINLYKEGGEHDNFKVQFCRNGVVKISTRKAPPKTVTEKIVERHSAQGKGGMLSTQDLLLEHVLDLENKVTKISMKHKKLKKKYKSICSDIYVDDDEASGIAPKPQTKQLREEQQTAPIPQPQTQPEPIDEDDYEQTPDKQEYQQYLQSSMRRNKSPRSNWRQMVLQNRM